MRERIDRVAEEEDGERLTSIGTMIELPRACFVADRIAEQAEFFSFGTNDLTQTGARLLARGHRGARSSSATSRSGSSTARPFETIDEPGVGQLVRHGRVAGARGSARR